MSPGMKSPRMFGLGYLPGLDLDTNSGSDFGSYLVLVFVLVTLGLTVLIIRSSAAGTSGEGCLAWSWVRGVGPPWLVRIAVHRGSFVPVYDFSLIQEKTSLFRGRGIITGI